MRSLRVGGGISGFLELEILTVRVYVSGVQLLLGSQCTVELGDLPVDLS